MGRFIGLLDNFSNYRYAWYDEWCESLLSYPNFKSRFGLGIASRCDGNYLLSPDKEITGSDFQWDIEGSNTLIVLPKMVKYTEELRILESVYGDVSLATSGIGVCSRYIDHLVFRLGELSLIGFYKNRVVSLNNISKIPIVKFNSPREAIQVLNTVFSVYFEKLGVPSNMWDINYQVCEIPREVRRVSVRKGSPKPAWFDGIDSACSLRLEFRDFESAKLFAWMFAGFLKQNCTNIAKRLPMEYRPAVADNYKAMCNSLLDSYGYLLDDGGVVVKGVFYIKAG